MSSRDRACGHLIPHVNADMPAPQMLARLLPVMKVLVDCASAYDAIDPAPTTITDWVVWLDVEVRQAAGWQPRSRSGS